MQKVYIMMGLPGSGKTTWAKEKSNQDGDVIIGRDDIRHMLRHSHDYDSSKKNQKYVWDVSQYMIKEAIQRGFDTILDQMSLTSEQRIKTVVQVRRYAKSPVDVILVYCSESEENVDRRMNSDMVWGDRKYYEKLIEKMKYEMEEPDFDEEDFDGMIRVPGHSERLLTKGAK